MRLSDYEEQEFEEHYRKPRVAKQKQTIQKQSYESNAEVQRWLKEQSLDREGPPPFEPSLLAGRRDRDWIMSSLTHFYEQELITDVLHIAKSGKEATVFCCAAHPSTGELYLAAKIYRPRMFRSLRNDAIYRENRAQRDREGRPTRGVRARTSKASAGGRAQQVGDWIAHEFETQRLMYAAGARVPKAYAQIGNAVLMAYLGDADDPAPRLSEVALEPSEAGPLFAGLLRDVERCLAANRIHGDLSAYNILYWQGQATIIDFAQAVDARRGEDVYPLLERDLSQLQRAFARYGVEGDPRAIAASMWEQYLRGELG